MDHAVVAPGITTWAVVLPPGAGHQLLERLVMGVGNEVAGTLPAHYVVSRVTPGRARQLAFPREELRITWGVENPEPFRELVHIAELLSDIVAGHEDFAVVYRRIAIGRRNGVALHVEFFQEFKQLPDLVHVGFLVDSRVGHHLETVLFRSLDSVDGLLEHALLFDAEIVRLFEAV